MRSSLRLAGLAALAVIWAAAASAQTVSVGGGNSITISGFISATAFTQDQNFTFGNGQNAEFPVPPETKTDRWFEGADVRNTRLHLAFSGPKVVGEWKIDATLEADFFGGFNGTGAFSEQQPNPRLRLAYVDFTNGSTTIRAGQQWSPLFGNVPVSVSHIAFPLGYGAAGDVGWRFPGISLTQKLTQKGAPVNADFVLAVMNGSWSTPGNLVDYGTAGNAGFPQVELRFNLSGKAGGAGWGVYAVGHYDEKDLSGAGASKPDDKLKGTAVEFGAKLTYEGLLVQGNIYTGHSIGQQFAAITQFGKIQSTGGWAQVGYDFTKNWGLYGFYGIDDPKDSDALAAVGANARVKNEMYSGMLRWKTGPFSVGLEWLHDKLTTGAAKTTTTGNQASLSALYVF
jgi:hypothetical protein